MDIESKRFLDEAENKLRQDARGFLKNAHSCKTAPERLNRIVSNLVQIDIQGGKNIALANLQLNKMLTRENRLGKANSIRYDINRHIAIKQAINALNDHLHSVNPEV